MHVLLACQLRKMCNEVFLQESPALSRLVSQRARLALGQQGARRW